MKLRPSTWFLLSIALPLALLVVDAKTRRTSLRARVIATGIPGAGAISEVGDFLRGSPMHDNGAFTPFAQPGAILDPKRILVASTSNFGAPLARASEPEGSILSIDPASDAIPVPSGFAAAGGQVSAMAGAVQLYAGQSASFLNSVKEPQAATAAFPSVSLPLGISLNNGNGRPWIANAPNGAAGISTITVLDPQGYPFAGAPNANAGGVFAGDLTNRNANSKGLTSAALGTAIITKSPDLTGRAVFAAVHADGSVTQINVLKGVDLLAPAGTVTPLLKVDRDIAESTEAGVVARKGIVFNWVPSFNLFITDPLANRLVVLDLKDDGVMFSANRREISLPEFNLPVDLTPATREVSSGSFASNTTLGGGSDLYVVNRGDNSIVRMSVGGGLVAVRDVEADVDGFRLNGIAISSDGQTIYLTAVTPGGGGVLLSVPAFGGAASSAQFVSQAVKANAARDMNTFGKFMFSLELTPAQGLGPLFNDKSCAGCHSTPAVGGSGIRPGQDVKVAGKMKNDGTFTDVVARAHSVSELGVPCDVSPGIPAGFPVVSLRNAMALRGGGVLDTIALGDVLANMALQPEAVRGRPNLLPDGRMGKFGWKAQVPTLVEFMGLAFRNEMGVTNPLEPRDIVKGCGANTKKPDVDASTLQAAAKFLNTIDPPVPASSCTASDGAAVFQKIGCATCHTPTMPGPGARQLLPVYSDLLLHDMGPGLDDRLPQHSASGSEWRTPPLWMVSERGKLLHDGRAITLPAAIGAHGGQGQAAADAFAGLDGVSKDALIAFLKCL